jgi:hypothetical protein
MFLHIIQIASLNTIVSSSSSSTITSEFRNCSSNIMPLVSAASVSRQQQLRQQLCHQQLNYHQTHVGIQKETLFP